MSHLLLHLQRNLMLKEIANLPYRVDFGAISSWFRGYLELISGLSRVDFGAISSWFRGYLELNNLMLKEIANLPYRVDLGAISS